MKEWKIKRLMLFIQPSDYDEWITYPMITIAEFGLLLADCNPDVGKKGLNSLLKELEAMNGDIIDKTYIQWPKYKNLLHILRKLDRSRTQFTKRDEDLYSDKQKTIYSDSKWQMDFLVYFAKKIGIEVPAIMSDLNKDFNPDIAEKRLLKTKLDKKHLLIDGWFNLDACRAPKLVALIYAYAKEEELCQTHPNRKFSTTNVATHINASYEVVGSDGTDHDEFVRKLSNAASIQQKGASLKKREPNNKA